jgi:PmbA protein
VNENEDDTMNKKERMDLALWAMNYALQQSANQSAVNIAQQREVEIEYRNKQLDKLQESTQSSLRLSIYVDQRYSSHSTNDLRKPSLQKFIQEAIASTKYLTRDEFRSLPDAKYYPKAAAPDLVILDPGYPNVESADRVKMAAAIEASAMAQSQMIISTTASYSDVHYESVQVHNNGFTGEAEGTVFSAGAEVTVNDQKGGRPEDYFQAQVRFLADLPPTGVIGTSAAERALHKIGQGKIDSGVYDMIVENRAASRLLGTLVQPMSARALQQKRSFLDGKLGQRVASEKLTVIDDPFVPRGMASRAFDGEGLAAARRVKIDKGVLMDFYVDNYYGKKLSMEPNSGSSSNLVFEYGSRSMEEMIKDIQKGIVVNGFIGGNSNSTTGDFSFGIVGLLVENGQVTKPVNEMNISGNAIDFWNALTEMGNDPYSFSSWRIPSMFFKGVQFSGI